MCSSQLFPPYKTAHTHTFFTHVACLPHAPFLSKAHLFPPPECVRNHSMPSSTLRSCFCVCFSTSLNASPLYSLLLMFLVLVSSKIESTMNARNPRKTRTKTSNARNAFGT